ncbi:hypothetical protein DID96_17060 [Burkholderia sp. Bp8963]|nr:hypothetical protein DID96_17060 [Burkholderia sp. Bp8963]
MAARLGCSVRAAPPRSIAIDQDQAKRKKAGSHVRDETGCVIITFPFTSLLRVVSCAVTRLSSSGEKQ